MMRVRCVYHAPGCYDRFGEEGIVSEVNLAKETVRIIWDDAWSEDVTGWQYPESFEII